MNWKTILIFIGVLFTYELLVYGLWRGFWWSLSPYINSNFKLILSMIFFVIANLSIIFYTLRLGSPYTNYSNIWFYYFVYGLLILIFLTVTNLILKIFGSGISQGFSLIFSSLALIFVTIFGLYWAYSPVVKEQTIKIDKHLEKPMKVAVVADLHLGTFFGNGALEKLNTIVQNNNVDALIIAGDLMDDDMVIYKQRNMGESLAKIKTPYGTFASMGNHDRAASEIVSEVAKSGVHALLDESITLDNGVTLIGRKDNTDRARKSTADILHNVDTTNPIILIDHQPTDINTHKDLPIDIQFSGHTHHGQFWPFNYITERLYVLDYGYANINGRHFFTTAGYGFWGPPFKTSARSEVLIITIEGNK